MYPLLVKYMQSEWAVDKLIICVAANSTLITRISHKKDLLWGFNKILVEDGFVV